MTRLDEYDHAGHAINPAQRTARQHTRRRELHPLIHKEPTS